MHLICIRPDEPEDGRAPERLSPWLGRTPGIEAIHRLHVRLQETCESLGCALAVVEVRTLGRYVLPIGTGWQHNWGAPFHQDGVLRNTVQVSPGGRHGCAGG